MKITESQLKRIIQETTGKEGWTIEARLMNPRYDRSLYRDALADIRRLKTENEQLKRKLEGF